MLSVLCLLVSGVIMADQSRDTASVAQGYRQVKKVGTYLFPAILLAFLELNLNVNYFQPIMSTSHIHKANITDYHNLLEPKSHTLTQKLTKLRPKIQPKVFAAFLKKFPEYKFMPWSWYFILMFFSLLSSYYSIFYKKNHLSFFLKYYVSKYNVLIRNL